MTYNIWNGGGDRLPEIATVIQHANADVVAIQEANDEQDFYELAQELGLHGVLGYGNRGFHVGLLSRYYISSWTNHADRLVFHHALLEAQIETPLGTLAVFVAHLYPGYEDDGEERRLNEVRAALGYMQPFEADLCLLAGDFNTLAPQDALDLAHWPQNWQQRIQQQGGNIRRDAIAAVLAAGYRDSYRALHPSPTESGYTRTRGYKPGYTLPAPNPNVRLDYIFASPALALTLQNCDVVTGDDARHASDHLPVVAQFGR